MNPFECEVSSDVGVSQFNFVNRMIGKTWSFGHFHDLTVQSRDGYIICANKIILASASWVLNTILRESNDYDINNPLTLDVDKVTLHQVLHLIYYNKVLLTDDRMDQLKEALDKYGIKASIQEDECIVQVNESGDKLDIEASVKEYKDEEKESLDKLDIQASIPEEESEEVVEDLELRKVNRNPSPFAELTMEEMYEKFAKLKKNLYVCMVPECLKTFKCKRYILSHFCDLHIECYSTYPCPKCGSVLRGQKSFRAHIILKHPELRKISYQDLLPEPIYKKPE